MILYSRERDLESYNLTSVIGSHNHWFVDSWHWSIFQIYRARSNATSIVDFRVLFPSWVHWFHEGTFPLKPFFSFECVVLQFRIGVAIHSILWSFVCNCLSTRVVLKSKDHSSFTKTGFSWFVRYSGVYIFRFARQVRWVFLSIAVIHF